MALAAGLVVPRLIAAWFLHDGTPDRARARRRGPAPAAPWRGLGRGAIGNRRVEKT